MKWMNHLFLSVWCLGENISINEMTMTFKGYHKDKLRITYKREGVASRQRLCVMMVLLSRSI